MDVGTLEAEFRSREADYSNLVEAVIQSLSSELVRQPRLKITGRAKAWDSFLRKAILNPSAGPPEGMSDRAGVRVVIPELDFAPIVRSAIEARFEVIKRDDKMAKLGADRLGYLGEHFDVRFRADGSPPMLAGLVCEIQVRTIAQSAWAEVGHELIYKRAADLPTNVMRSFNRLMALVELFDAEVARLRFTISSTPEFLEVRMLDALEPLFLRVAGSPYDKPLAVAMLQTIKTSYDEDELMGFRDLITRFVDMNDTKLHEVFIRYPRASGLGPIVNQPESLAIFERLESKPMLLRHGWDAALPAEILYELAAIWGTPI